MPGPFVGALCISSHVRQGTTPHPGRGSCGSFFAQSHHRSCCSTNHSAGDADLQLRSLAHGVLLLEHLPFEYGHARRRLRIVKLRATSVTEGFHDFVIIRGGLTVFPQLVPDDNTHGRPRVPVTSGLPELDALLGGGLTWGTTTLFIGAAGVGKSTVAAQYLCGAADPSGRAAVFLFDEGVRRSWRGATSSA